MADTLVSHIILCRSLFARDYDKFSCTHIFQLSQPALWLNFTISLTQRKTRTLQFYGLRAVVRKPWEGFHILMRLSPLIDTCHLSIYSGDMPVIV